MFTIFVGDSLAAHNGKRFTTFDQDNDLYTGNCAAKYTGLKSLDSS